MTGDPFKDAAEALLRLTGSIKSFNASLGGVISACNNVRLDDRLAHPDKEIGDDQFEAFLAGLYSKDGDE
jgi:hypothetical protein